MKIKDISGKRFGRLKVLKQAGKNSHGNYLWLCRCDCGNEKIIDGASLRNGSTKSCGCLRKDLTVARCKKENPRRKNRLYHVYNNMKGRCNNSKDAHFKDYGGRGIKVCDRWLGKSGFDNFLKDMGECPDGCSIDRIDVNGNYEPSNCRWATTAQQNRNRTDTIKITHNGNTKCLSEWCRELNLPYSAINNRIKKLGWSIERAFNTPIRGKRK